jgi:hypothetical protein
MPVAGVVIIITANHTRVTAGGTGLEVTPGALLIARKLRARVRPSAHCPHLFPDDHNQEPADTNILAKQHWVGKAK